MIGTEEETGLEIHAGVSRENTLMDGFLEALFNRRDVGFGD